MLLRERGREGKESSYSNLNGMACNYFSGVKQNNEIRNNYFIFVLSLDLIVMLYSNRV